jgi:hypothetical protein
MQAACSTLRQCLICSTAHLASSQITTVRPGFCKVVRLGCCIYQIFKESGDGNKLSNNIAEFEDLYNIAAVTQLSVVTSASASKHAMSNS